MDIKFIENIKFVLNTYNEDKLLCSNSVYNVIILMVFLDWSKNDRMYIKFIENVRIVLYTYNEDKLLCPNSVSNALAVLSPILCSCLLLDMG